MDVCLNDNTQFSTVNAYATAQDLPLRGRGVCAVCDSWGMSGESRNLLRSKHILPLKLWGHLSVLSDSLLNLGVKP